MLNPKRDRTIESDFDAWLDAFVAGRTASTPPGTDATPVTQRQNAASRFHALAAANAGTSLDGPSAELDAIWGNVMDRTTPTPDHASRSVLSTAGQPVDRRQVRRLSADLPGGPKVHAAINSLLAAGLILAVMAGFWRVTGGFSPGGDDGQELPFGAAVETPQGGMEPEGTADLQATAEEGDPLRPTAEVAKLSNEPPIDMPKPSDCTVEPLTVDDVLAIVEGPDSKRDLPLFLEEAFDAPIPEEGYLSDVPPSQETIDAIAQAHRQRVACVMAGSWFQYWALSAETVVSYEVMTTLYPTYITPGEARALLEEVEATGSAGALPPLDDYHQLNYVSLVSPDPAHSNMFDPAYIQVGTVTYRADGVRVVGNEESAAKLDQVPNRQYLSYGWNETLGLWLHVSPMEAGIGGRVPMPPTD